MRAYRTLAAGVLLGLLCMAAEARADQTDQCIAADEQAQADMQKGHFASARKSLQFCIDTCPKVSAPCAGDLSKLNALQTSVVFDVRSTDQRDLGPMVVVSIDGQALGTYSGTAVPVDTGSHLVTFEMAGRPPTTITINVIQTDKDRRVEVLIGNGEPPPSPTSTSSSLSSSQPPPPPPPPPPASPSNARTIGLIATGGVGVAAVAAGVVLGLLASDAKNDYERHCGSSIGAPAPNLCDAQGVGGQSDASTKAALSTTFFAVGGLALAGGAVLFLTAPHGDRTVGVSAGPGSLLIHGRF